MIIALTRDRGRRRTFASISMMGGIDEVENGFYLPRKQLCWEKYSL